MPIANHKSQITDHNLAFLFIIFLILELSVPSRVPAYESAYLITYGADAKTIEGDNDFLQVIFIRIPEHLKNSVYIRIFDADCGGRLDDLYSGQWDTRTRFRIFGGKGAWSDPGLKSPFPAKSDLSSGVLMADEEFGKDPFRDYQWHTFAQLHPEEGEKVGEFRYFRIVVEGKSGDDGNCYQIAVSRESQRNVSAKGVETFNFTPTLRLPKQERFAEMRFFVPRDKREIVVHNFDLPGSVVGVNTAFRANLPVTAAGQDKWEKSSVLLDENETGRAVAVRFEDGEEIPNDGTFYVTDKQGNLLPVEIPVYLQKPNLLPEPQIHIELLSDCNPVLFDGSRSTDPEGDSLRFFWEFGDGTTGKGVRVTHHYDAPGRYEASVIVEDASGQVTNSVLEKFVVTINHPPEPDAGPDRIAAPREKIEFDGSGSADPDGEVVTYYWDFGDGTKAQGANVQHRFRQPDLYVVTLRVEDDSGSPCKSATDQCEVFINAPPVVDIGEDRIASAGEELRFSGANSGDSDGDIISYEWNLGDGTEKTGADIAHSYETPGIYKVTLKVTDNSGVKNRSASDTLNVFVNDPPIADAGDTYRAAVGEEVLLDGSGSSDRDGQLIEFKWDFGDGTQETENCEVRLETCGKISHRYDNPGRYQVTLTVKDDSGSSSDTDQDNALVIVNAPPAANAGPDQWVTSSEVQFDGTGSADPDGDIIQYSWDFGDGSTGTGPSPVHVYKTPGVYRVRLTIRDDSATSTDRSSDEMTVTVNHLPFADAGPDQVGVPGQPIYLDASASVDPDGDISAFEWIFGDGGNSKLETRNSKLRKVSHIYAKPGRYKALLTVYDNSGHAAAINFDEVTIVINEPPVAIVSYRFSGKDAQASELAVAPGDTVQFDGTRSYDPDGKLVSYQWEIFGNSELGTENSEPVFNFQFPRPGVYTVVLTVADDSRVENSMSQDEMLIRVNHPPVANAGKDIHTNERTVFLDASASTDADGDSLIYTWDFGDKTPAEKGEKVFHTYAKGGNYPVILTADDGTGVKNARATSSIRVKINKPPVADAGGDKTVCAGKIVIFDGVASADPEKGLLKYHWDFGDGETAEGVNPTKIYNKGGVYAVTLTVTDDSGLPGGNMGADQITVKVIESPVANAGPDQTACAGTIVRFDGTKSKDLDGFIDNFQWNFGDDTVGGGPSPIHVYTKAGVYRVRLTVTGDYTGDCDNTDDDEMMVTIHEAPIAEITCPSAAEPQKPVLFGGEGGEGRVKGEKAEARGDAHASLPKPHAPIITNWNWDFGDGAKGEGEQAEHTYAKSGEYIVTLTVTSDSDTDCNTSSKQKRININEPPVAVAGEDRLVGVNQVITFDGASSTDQDGVISAYDWDFGDGNTAAGVRIRHQYEAAGRYDVSLKVTDNTDLGNNSHTDTLSVTVNESPVSVISKFETRNSQFETPDPSFKFQVSSFKFSACPGEEVMLSGRDSSDSDGEIVRYTWNFGDGSPSEEGTEVRHSWRFTGCYVIVLEVDDGRGVSNSRSQTSAIIVVNEPPIADAGAYRIVSPGEDVLFEVSARDWDGSVVSFQWDFGDADVSEKIEVQNSKFEKVSHKYETPGEYQARVTVYDDSGSKCNFAEDVVKIRVNAPPVADAGGNREGFVGGAHDALIFDATGSHDADGDPLTFYWDFGDGEDAHGAKVVHGFKEPGEYKVRLRADDGTGVTSGADWDEITVLMKERK
ncbi:PKD domain-containing protein [Desulfonema magnum]|uniref:PKD domain-containing protein n=1 Tax=Desulfonema magnum TaxID=45655 RepID=A0A975BHA8_9BACT|nr:PKD domain-containing protein [Desulfonema magnum]QTA85729.1 PKD domain-containing protein [Desulfonema magnum]